MQQTSLIFGSLFAFTLVTSACSEDSEDSNESVQWAITSPAFTDGAPLPLEATCDGKPFAEGTIPQLDWTNGPEGTQSYAVIFKVPSIIDRNDPETMASAYNRGFHWVIWDIPANIRQIPAGTGAAEFPPEVPGARQWASRNQFRFFPACPNFDPTMERATETYSFTLYALPAPILDFPPKQDGVNNYTRTIHDTIEAVAIAKTELRGTSNAFATTEPPMVDPATVMYPAPRP